MENVIHTHPHNGVLFNHQKGKRNDNNCGKVDAIDNSQSERDADMFPSFMYPCFFDENQKQEYVLRLEKGKMGGYS